MIYENITRAQYDDLEGINFSKLKHFKESIKKGIFELTNKIKSPALAIGSACHVLALEPHNFEKQFVIGGPINPKTNETFGRGTQAFEAWLSENKKDIDQVLSEEDYLLCQDVAERAKIKSAINNANLFEFAMTWTDEKTGMKCKCLVDFARKGHYIGDLKTTDLSLSYDSLSREIYKRQYHEQASFYLSGAEANKLIDNEKFLFVFVQKKDEKDTLEIELGWESIELGKSENLKCLNNYSEYLKGQTYGYKYPHTLDVPNWALNAHFNQDEFSMEEV